MKNIFRILIGGIFVSIILIGCSSSSHNQRYKKPKEKDKDSPSKSVRFTSKDNNDEKKSTNESINSFRNIDKNEFDETPVEEYKIDTKAFVKKYAKLKSFNISLTKREKVLFEIVNFLDTPYQYGGNSEKGIDCSAFTQNVFNNSVNLSIPRTASEQFKWGEDISIPGRLKFGDLVFFNTSKTSYPGHVGIYLGDNLFAHASRSLGVTVSSLKSNYYTKRYVGGRRISKNFESQ